MRDGYRLKWWAKGIAHRRGLIASPSLAYRGVPFGPQKRDLAGELAADLWRRHEAGQCAICYPDAYRSCPPPDEAHQGVKEVKPMMCGMCGYPGAHTVAQDPNLPLPKRCAECARCQQEERDEQQRADTDAR